MAGLSDSKVREFEVTPRALHKAVIRVGNPSREELD